MINDYIPNNDQSSKASIDFAFVKVYEDVESETPNAVVYDG